MYLLLQQVSLDQLGAILGRASVLPLVLLVVAVTGGLVARAFRWQVYFQPERRVPFGPLLGTLAISYMASTFLPFRAGELVRAVFLGRRESIPVPRVVGTILLEKLFDFLAIGVMLVLLLVTRPLPGAAIVAGTSIAGAILGGFGFVVALAVWREPTLRLVGWVERLVPLGLGARLHLTSMARHFAEGTDSLRVPALWLPMLGWTLVAWLFALASSWLGAMAIGLALGLDENMFLAVVTSTGQAVPSSPGYVGVYHAAAVLALTAFGIPASLALAAAVLIHALSYGSLVIVGLVALWLGGYEIRDLAIGLRGSSVAESEREPDRPAAGPSARESEPAPTVGASQPAER